VERLAAQVQSDGEALVLFNTLGWERSGWVEAPAPWPAATYRDGEGTVTPSQPIAVDGERRLLIWADRVPPYGWKTLRCGEGAVATVPGLSVERGRLENRYLRVLFDEAGRITSLVDKRRAREVIADGRRGNELILFEDKPLNNDAWNIDVFYEEKAWLLDAPAETEVVENGPVRATIEFCRSFQHSTLRQRVSLYADSPRLDFDTWVDWHEHHQLLKVAFPVTVLSPRATYEIQFGSIERPTHRNTSWDYARFEVPAQRWADLSEGDYGVSLLNDCKYGYDVHENVMRLTLIKSATSPDPEADQGEHRFTYSLLPHQGTWRRDTVRHAAELNVPLIACATPGGGSLPGKWSFVRASADNLVIDTVKQAEDGAGMIVRLYEAHGQRGNGRLYFGHDLGEAWECNLLEEPERAVDTAGPSLGLDYRPYEIRTFRVRLG